MGTTQLSFAPRLPSGAKSVHLLGSWDNYRAHLPLTKSRALSTANRWMGTFRFPPITLQAGKRYWYYYIIDGYKITHDPKQSYVTEPTTKRILNILNVPPEGVSHKSSVKPSSLRNLTTDSNKLSSKHNFLPEKVRVATYRRGHCRDSSNLTVDIPHGRPLSISEIQSPKPITPHSTKFILEADYSSIAIENLTSQLNTATIDRYQSSPSESSSSSSYSSLSRSESVSPSSASSLSDNNSLTFNSACTCKRYGITRKRERQKLDCGGSRCGYNDDSSSYCSSEEDNYPKRWPNCRIAT